ncbi:MAG TPA: hypothetical protein VFJ88_06660, partial [Chthoniobacterales bacterium]|nr:hypothetical protein [Chthoniobacterales bacterium]
RLPPDLFFHQDLGLMVFRPRGILDEKTVLRIVRFLDREEDLCEHAFNRFTDTSKLDALDLDERFVYRIALHRRRTYMGRPPVKSAFYVTSAASRHYVQIHAVVNDYSPLRVKLFRHLDEAADWLQVPRQILET